MTRSKYGSRRPLLTRGSVKTIQKYEVLLDSDIAHSEINSQPSECFDKRHHICYEGRNYTPFTGQNVRLSSPPCQNKRWLNTLGQKQYLAGDIGENCLMNNLIRIEWVNAIRLPTAPYTHEWRNATSSMSKKQKTTFLPVSRNINNSPHIKMERTLPCVDQLQLQLHFILHLHLKYYIMNIKRKHKKIHI